MQACSTISSYLCRPAALTHAGLQHHKLLLMQSFYIPPHLISLILLAMLMKIQFANTTAWSFSATELNYPYRTTRRHIPKRLALQQAAVFLFILPFSQRYMRYDVASFANRVPTFRTNTLPLLSRPWISHKNRPYLCLSCVSAMNTRIWTSTPGHPSLLFYL